MLYSNDRILTTHAGSLPRPAELREMVVARTNGQAYDAAALDRMSPAGAFLPANSPGTIEHWMANEHYKTDEEFVFAIAEAMNEEYRAIIEAGFLLQIDDPDLPDGWNCLPDVTLPEYRNYATVRGDALHHALRG